MMHCMFFQLIKFKGPVVFDPPTGSYRQRWLRDSLLPHADNEQQLPFIFLAQGCVQRASIQVQEESKGFLYCASNILDKGNVMKHKSNFLKINTMIFVGFRKLNYILKNVIDDDVVVYNVYGSGHKTKGAQLTRSRVPLFCHVTWSTGDTCIHNRIWYVGKNILCGYLKKTSTFTKILNTNCSSFISIVIANLSHYQHNMLLQDELDLDLVHFPWFSNT